MQESRKERRWWRRGGRKDKCEAGWGWRWIWGLGWKWSQKKTKGGCRRSGKESKVQPGEPQLILKHAFCKAKGHYSFLDWMSFAIWFPWFPTFESSIMFNLRTNFRLRERNLKVKNLTFVFDPAMNLGSPKRQTCILHHYIVHPSLLA